MIGNPFETKIKPGIAVVCAVKNRDEPLRYTLSTYLMRPEVKQFILLDWDSNKPLLERLQQFDIPHWPDRRVVLVRVVDQPYWNSAKAYNVAMRFVTRTKTFKADADVALVYRFENQPELGKSFVAGDWKNARQKNEWFLHGTVFFCTKDFWEIGGYDERFNTYGYEDDNFYQRLVANGLKQRTFAHGELLHLPHSAQKRNEHHEKRFRTLRASINYGRRRSKNLTNWSKESPLPVYQFIKIDEQEKYCELVEI